MLALCEHEGLSLYGAMGMLLGLHAVSKSLSAALSGVNAVNGSRSSSQMLLYMLLSVRSTDSVRSRGKKNLASSCFANSSPPYSR